MPQSPVTTSVPQGSIIKPILLNIFFNDLDDGLGKCTLSSFADDPTLERAADTPDGFADIQRDLHGLERWADRNLMKFSKGKCKVLPLGRTKPRHQYLLGPVGWKAAPQRTWRSHAGQVDHSPATHLHSKDRQWHPGLPSEKHHQQVEGSDLFPLLSTSEMHLECWVQACVSQYKRDMDVLEYLQQRATKIKGLEHLSYDKSLR